MATDFSYRVERSRRKTVTLKICPDGTVLVLAPLMYPIQDIEILLERHRLWIERHRDMVARRTAREKAVAGTAEQIEELYRQARETIPPRVAYFAQCMGVEPSGVRITSAAKRFGSCSGKNSLCFSYRVMMYPPEVIDYVIVHELAHIRYHDHSRSFYAFIESILPNYRQYEAALKERN